MSFQPATEARVNIEVVAVCVSTALPKEPFLQSRTVAYHPNMVMVDVGSGVPSTGSSGEVAYRVQTS
ncbi:hypothetical protein INT44_000757 [Umbelopsis vinacea]|uniref:Uncharacterized protein n=1 Tax=Umbelopsis vinacea TaxID=44442 RepID=A0A8H7Q8K5_9FUNG|nr:hypothetical protein INT44_000757 [Umbelopsis vinacea]